MAEHYYNLLNKQLLQSNSFDTVKVVHLLYEIGMRLLQDSQHELAVKWLGRASSVMACCKEICSATDTGELRLNVLHTYGKASETFNLAVDA
jgi:Meiosis protein SPO22/ZIP4 like